MPPSLSAKTQAGLSVAAPGVPKRVHLALACCSVVLLIFCLAVEPPGARKAAEPLLITFFVLTGPLLLPAVLFHDKKKWAHRDSALMLPWTLLIALLIVQAAPITATFAFPLRDGLWRHLDQSIGINVPQIVALSRRHPAIDHLLFNAYAFTLHPLIIAAILLPALLGKREAAERFVLSNALSFVIALPLMIFVPAVGPWVGWNFPPDGLQQACQATIYALRQGSLNTHDFGGIVCLPSFHTFWAVVSAQALYCFRTLRYPAILVATLITISTVTTGWHYAVDVFAGLIMFIVCTVASNAVIYGRWKLVSRTKQEACDSNNLPVISPQDTANSGTVCE